MGEYIECEKLPQKKTRGFFIDDDFSAGWNACLNNIKNIPAADVRPAVRGKWMPKNEIGDCCYQCSDCGFVRDAYILDIGNFCPNCGADMREQPREEA